MMIAKASSALAAIAGAAVLFSAPASAQSTDLSVRLNLNDGRIELAQYGPNRGYHGPRRGYVRELSPRQVRFQLRERGFRGIRFLREGRRAYLFEAFGRRGNLVRVRVNKFNGYIMNVERIGDRRGRGRGHGRGYRSRY